MLGGGVFVTQNKVLPGSYINIVSAASTSANLGERGMVAIALPLGKAPGTVINITSSEFVTSSQELLGKSYDSDDVAPLREIFANATRVYIFDLGTDGDYTVSNVIGGLEPYEFNTLCAYTSESSEITQYITGVKDWRNNYGKKCQVVVYNATKPNDEGVINVISTISDATVPAHALTAWVAGAQAGCNINASVTNKIYDGQYTIVADKTQTQLEASIKAGEFVFHNVYGDIRVLEDINSLTETTSDKGEDFKSNQTIRVVDQIANDIAKLFNTKYLGKIPNDTTGRECLWADIVAHHRELETLRAIENFDETEVIVEQGRTKKAVVVHDVITVTNAMAQLYMTVVIQ